MNKLIIAGNGFDLAHGLPTSYNDFMDAFWRDLKENQNDELVKEIVHLNSEYQSFLDDVTILNYNDFIVSLLTYMQDCKSPDFEAYSIKVKNGLSSRWKTFELLQFKNQFFKKLSKKQSIQNWIDVENEYYQALKDISKNKVFKPQEKREEVLKLHKEFEQVKQLLERYLQKNVAEVYDFANPQGDYLYHLDKNKEQIEILMNHLETKEDESFLYVNFNYTSTFELFYSVKSQYINHIHGKLNKDIVFGFGDEMDDDYKLIEDMDDNEYLKYFKSFQYVQNSNYKDVLRYINSEKFQVIIMGHSCGLSDRTLLNTIFEHENCRSIKVFYHQKEDGTDNYTETIQNISRHFNDKKLMRTKIVEKTLCEPMPQIQLPKLVKKE